MRVASKINSAKELAGYFDHTILRKDATEDDIRKLCAEASEFRFKSVCVESLWLPVAKQVLEGSPVLLCTVVSFPAGDSTFQQKAEETKKAVALGAQEIDMVLNRKFLFDNDYKSLLTDISSVVEAAGGRCVKVILECSELTDSQKAVACAVAKLAGASFVKTSTGFSKSGATVEDVRLMRETVGEAMGVKASGGVRSLTSALAMIEAGASRLGTSSSVAILKEFV